MLIKNNGKNAKVLAGVHLGPGLHAVFNDADIAELKKIHMVGLWFANGELLVMQAEPVEQFKKLEDVEKNQDQQNSAPDVDPATDNAKTKKVK